MSNILVTGGLGFIGSNFISKIIDKEKFVVNIDSETYASIDKSYLNFESNKNYMHYNVNISNYKKVNEIINKYSFDTIFHFAAESHVDNSIESSFEFCNTNVIGTLNLLESYHKLNKKNKLFIHVSTDEVYGSVKEGFFDENSNYKPNSPYSASKASSDHFVRAYRNTYGMPVIVSNCSNNYGPNQFPEKLLPLCINNIKNSKPLPIYGKGDNIRDWLFVVDHARAIDTIFHDGKEGDTYNIGGFNEWKNLDIVELLCDVMDRKLGNEVGTSRKLITFVTDRAGHDKRYAIDASKIKNELGWEPSLQFEEGMEKTVDWYLANQEWLDHITSGDYQSYYENQYTR